MSNIIESLVISLGLDPEKLKKGLHEVGAGLAALGKKADETLEHIEGLAKHGEPLIEHLKEHIVGMLGALASVGAFMAFTEHTMKAGAAMIYLSKETKMAVEDISLWQNAAVMAGGSAEGFNNGLKHMAESLSAIEKGMPRAKRALMAFQQAGITGLGKGIHTEITTVFEKAHEKLSEMAKKDVAASMMLGKRMGFDEATIRVLSKTGEAYDEFMAKAKAAGIVTKEEAEAAHEAEEAQNEMKISMQRFAETIVQYALPAMKWLSETMTEFAQWMRTHPEVIKAALTGIGIVMTALGVKALWMGAKMALGWIIGLGPIGLVIAAIAAVIGLLTYLYLKFEGFREVVTLIGSFFATTFEQIKSILVGVWEFIKGYFMILIGIFTGNFDLIKKGWDKLWEGAKSVLTGFWDFVSDMAVVIVGEFVAAFAEIWENIKNSKLFKWMTGNKTGSVSISTDSSGATTMEAEGQSYSVDAGNVASAGMSVRPTEVSNSSSKTASSTTHIQSIEINAPAAKDAEAVAGEIGNALRRNLTNMAEAF